MLILTVALCVGMMAVCALVKGFTSRRLSELKRELSTLNIEEGRAKEKRGRIEIRLESAQARNNNLTFELEKGNKELERPVRTGRRVGNKDVQGGSGGEGRLISGFTAHHVYYPIRFSAH